MNSKRVLIVLTSFCAEGTPILVLDIVKLWLKQGITPNVVALKSVPTDLLPEFQSLNVPIHCLSMGNSGYARYVKLTVEIYRLCRGIGPDAVLSMPFGWHSFIAWGARLAGVKTVAAHVGNYPPHWTGSAFQKFRFFVQLGRPVTHRLVCCSNYVESGVIRWFKVSGKETLTIYNGCEFEQFDQGTHLSPKRTPEKTITIGMVARLERHKDQPTLIRAVRLLKSQGIDCQTWLIGEGSRRSEYEALIQSEDIGDCVHLLGMRRDIPELLQKLDVFVFSAKPDEGLGVALLEAMAAGVPIVATRVPACEEVLDDGRLGFLVEPGDEQAMADAILQVARDPLGAYHQAQAAREKVQREFTIAHMAQEYARCLQLLP
jgi:glycosyltransferase involved in cell wall biosynthesis